jgi:DNA polymerase
VTTLHLDFETRSAVDLRKAGIDGYANDPTMPAFLKRFSHCDAPGPSGPGFLRHQMTTLHLDFETRSAVDLKKAGIDVYANDPTTSVLCAAYAFDEDQVMLWRPRSCSPERMADHVASGGEVVAHNAAFEFNIWNRVWRGQLPGLPALKLEQMRCTQAEAYAMSLPGSLDGAAAALNVAQRKDKEGRRVMLALSQPRDFDALGAPVWYTEESHPEKFLKLYDYCMQDVEVERAIEKRLMRLSAVERATWVLDQTINGRGVGIDVRNAERALLIVRDEKKRMERELAQLTDKAVTSPSEIQALALWLEMQGVQLDGLTKQEVIDLLELDTLPLHARRAVELRQEYAKSSTSKIAAMLAARSADNRMRHLHQYHGAGTGRWAGRRVQTQNLKRPTIEQAEIEAIFGALENGTGAEHIETFHGNAMDALSNCLRGFIVAAPGHVLMAPDFANIEGRGVAWLAGERWKLDAFRAQDDKTGPGIYELSYSTSMGVQVSTVTKAQRQIGKVQELSMGYQGGVGAFQNMAKNYGVKVPDDEADRIKKLWRGAHPAIVRLWKDLEQAALNAVARPGRLYEAGVVPSAFKVSGSFLWCRLPSGRVLCYPYPRIELVEVPWEDEDGNKAKKDCVCYMGEDSKTHKWSRQKTYGGKLTENITQAICRDLLRDAMFRAEREGFPIVMHVHDELVVELPEAQADRLDELCEVVSEVPAWAKGLPVVAEGWVGRRYRK